MEGSNRLHSDFPVLHQAHSRAAPVAVFPCPCQYFNSVDPCDCAKCSAPKLLCALDVRQNFFFPKFEWDRAEFPASVDMTWDTELLSGNSSYSSISRVGGLPVAYLLAHLPPIKMQRSWPVGIEQAG